MKHFFEPIMMDQRKMLFTLTRVILPLLLVGLLGPCVFAADPLPSLKGLDKQLDGIEKALQEEDTDDVGLTVMRDRLDPLEGTLKSQREVAVAASERIKKDLEALGPPPQAGAPKEAKGLAARRKELEEQAAAMDAGIKESDLLAGRLDRILNEIKNERRRRFTERVLTRSFSPFDAALWQKSRPEWLDLLDRFRAVVVRVTQSAWDLSTDWIWILYGLVLPPALAVGIRRWLSAKARAMGSNAPSARVGVLLQGALMDAASLGVIPATTLWMLYVLFSHRAGLSSTDLAALAEGFPALLLGLLVADFVALFGRLEPLKNHLSQASDRLGSWLRILMALSILLGLDQLLDGILGQEDTALEILASAHITRALLVVSLLAGLLMCWPRNAAADQASLFPLMRGLVLVLAVSIAVTVLGGFVSLARILALHGLLTLGFLGLAGLGLKVLEDGDELPPPESLDPLESARLARAFWLRLGLKSLLLVMALLALLFLWSLDRRDLMNRLLGLVTGFKIGGLTISPSNTAFGLLIIGITVSATRGIQRFLELRAFPRTRLDEGLRHSIRTAVGYLGYILAAMLGLSTMGIDLSNLAIIAGALSVGLGFGLQNIVNNFVSGLILLIERPVKVGDLVRIGDLVGTVRKISIRATQIQTREQAWVFIPNSTLVSGTVINQSRADKSERLVISFTVDPDAPISAVEAVLKESTAAMPDIRKGRAPELWVRGWDDEALKLEWIVFVREPSKLATVGRDLPLAIFKSLRERGIRSKLACTPKLEVVLDSQGPSGV